MTGSMTAILRAVFSKLPCGVHMGPQLPLLKVNPGGAMTFKDAIGVLIPALLQSNLRLTATKLLGGDLAAAKVNPNVYTGLNPVVK